MIEHRHDVYGNLTDDEFADLLERARREDPDFEDE